MNKLIKKGITKLIKKLMVIRLPERILPEYFFWERKKGEFT